MPLSGWPVAGMILAGTLAAGGCAGALLGHFTVTGGLSPEAGWNMPDYGVERELARMPLPTALVRGADTPRFVGYPIEVPALTDPAEADAAARAYDALYDEPLDAGTIYPEAGAVDDPELEYPAYQDPGPAAGDAGEGAGAEAAPGALTRQMTLPTSSATSSAPVRSAVTPTGRPIALPSESRNPVSTSTGFAPGAGSPRAPKGI